MVPNSCHKISHFEVDYSESFIYFLNLVKQSLWIRTLFFFCGLVFHRPPHEKWTTKSYYKHCCFQHTITSCPARKKPKTLGTWRRMDSENGPNLSDESLGNLKCPPESPEVHRPDPAMTIFTRGSEAAEWIGESPSTHVFVERTRPQKGMHPSSIPFNLGMCFFFGGGLFYMGPFFFRLSRGEESSIFFPGASFDVIERGDKNWPLKSEDSLVFQEKARVFWKIRGGIQSKIHRKDIQESCQQVGNVGLLKKIATGRIHHPS